METQSSTHATAGLLRSPALSAGQVRLTRKEQELLLMLTQNAGRCVSRETLLRTIWHYSDGTRTRTVDVHVQRLRRKLGSAADSLKTIVRQGYCWFPEPEAAMGAGAL
ncbi:MAG: helix-turn-helix domain-containing protein [Bryobacteraceae bacterium]